MVNTRASTRGRNPPPPPPSNNQLQVVDTEYHQPTHHTRSPSRIHEGAIHTHSGPYTTECHQPSCQTDLRRRINQRRDQQDLRQHIEDNHQHIHRNRPHRRDRHRADEVVINQIQENINNLQAQHRDLEKKGCETLGVRIPP